MSLIDDETRAKISALLTSESDDFLEYLKIAELNPTIHLQHADLAETDFGEADVADWNLSGADLTNANLSKVQNIKLAIFDDQTTFANTMLPEGVTPSDLIK